MGGPQLQLQYHRDRHHQYDNVNQKIRNGVAEKELFHVDASSWLGLVPVQRDRSTLEQNGDEDRKTPGANEARDDPAGDLEFAHGKDASVEEEDGEFDGWDEQRI